MAHPANNFDSVRLVAALIVAIGHMSSLSGAFPVLNILSRPEASTAVDVFFCVSGYLVTDSWLRQPSLRVFVAKRALRIFPAVIAYTVLMVFVVGPALTTLGTGKYFGNHKSWSYLAMIGLYGAGNGLPGVFPHNPYSGQVNGALWTLPVEFACYLTVPLLSLLGRRGWMLALVGLVVLGGGWAEMRFEQERTAEPLLYGASLPFALMDVAYFSAASLLRLLAGRCRGLVRLDVALILCCVCFLCDEWWQEAVRPVTWVALPYMVIAFGEAATPVLRRAGRFGDVSYGLYLWHFPVMQAFIQLFGQDMPRAVWPVTIAATLGVAWLSWRLIERPALGLRARHAGAFSFNAASLRVRRTP